ncbi:hypothetical protein FB451DRAFT_79198 [Mycena latifolia]|nr:hypothetical protein FB451DRAFT_79198 [Mycena latifolia]
MPELYLDVLRAIIDQLDLDTLKAFSLAGRAVLPPSQRRLFSTFSVHSESSGKLTTFARARTLIQESPHIAAYIQDLTIDIPVLPDEDSTPLVFLLSALQNIRALKMRPTRIVRWNNIPAALTSAIRDVASRPSINELRLGGCRDAPLSFLFLAFTSVHTLTIRITEGHQFSATDIEELHAASFTPRLEELRFGTPSQLTRGIMHPILDFVLRSKCLEGLKRLQVALNRADPEYESRLFRSVSATLQHLEINLGESLSPLDLPAFADLRSVRLNFGMNHSGHESRSLPPWLSSFIENLPTVMPKIESLQFRVTIHHDVFRKRVLDVPWLVEQPCKLFTAPHQYRAALAALRQVHFGLVVKSVYYDTPPLERNLLFEQFCDAINAKCPGLAGTDILSFGIYDDIVEKEFLKNVEVNFYYRS